MEASRQEDITERHREDGEKVEGTMRCQRTHQDHSCQSKPCKCLLRAQPVIVSTNIQHTAEYMDLCLFRKHTPGPLPGE